VLVQLAQAPGRRLRPVEIARAVVLTRSGITRLVQGLERASFVERVECPDDARGFLVALTPAGLELVRRARETNLQGVAELFTDRYSDEELETLSGLLERLPG
jgi:DNA-binding MarR family transcriptional regulator